MPPMPPITEPGLYIPGFCDGLVVVAIGLNVFGILGGGTFDEFGIVGGVNVVGAL